MMSLPSGSGSLPKISAKRGRCVRSLSASDHSSCRRSSKSAKSATSRSTNFSPLSGSTPSGCHSAGSSRRSGLTDSPKSAWSHSFHTDDVDYSAKKNRLLQGKFGQFFENYFPDIRRRKKIVVFEPSDDEQYDTDLDTDLGFELIADEKSKSSREHGALAEYNTSCQKFGVVPNNYFQRHAFEENFTMKYRYPGYNDSKALTRQIKNHGTISRLDLEDNGIGPVEMLCVGEMLLNNDAITELKLANNNIGCFGMRLMRVVMMNNSHLVTMDLSGNKFGEKGAKYCADIMERNVYLRDLNIAHNGIEEKGAILLGHALAVNVTLEVLDISWNHIRYRGAVSLAKGIKNNTQLKVFRASMNGFHVDGTREMAEALENTQTLEELDLSANRIPKRGAVVLARALEDNRTLKILKIGFNPLTSRGAERILKAAADRDSSTLKLLNFEGVTVDDEFVILADDLKENFNINVVYTIQSYRRDRPTGLLNGYLETLVEFLADANINVQDLFLEKDNNTVMTSDDVFSQLQKSGIKIDGSYLTKLRNFVNKSSDKRFLLKDLFLVSDHHKPKSSESAATLTAETSVDAGLPDRPKKPEFGRTQSSLSWTDSQTGRKQNEVTDVDSNPDI